ncbi:MAG TPA: FAD/NAD(P)-binding protein, partial [Gammaproteobacteria bacterium]|nr:FAD/NAD(P)-binding protein [Gammaproteobacteria bacterium]
MLLLTRWASRFYTIKPTNQTINSLAIVGGGASLPMLLAALQALNKPLSIEIFDPHDLGTGHAFHPNNPMDFMTNTPGGDINGFAHWWSGYPVGLQKTWPSDEPVPRAWVGLFLREKLQHILDNPGTLEIAHIPKKVVDFHVPRTAGAEMITHLCTEDGARYSADAYVIAVGQIGPHKQLPGVPPARVVNSIYPFVKNSSPLTRALEPLLLESKTKPEVMIIGSGPSGIEATTYLLKHYESRIAITLVGRLDDIPREIVFNGSVKVLMREIFEATPDNQKYTGMDLFINTTGIN